jgi:phospholipase/carboxylesterase
MEVLGMMEPHNTLIEPPPEATVILLHGLGADGHDIESLVPELRLPTARPIRWIFPNAPLRPVTINGGHRMRAWYDIVSIDLHAPEDETGIRESARSIGELVSYQRERGTASDRIILAGFSQGGAIALFTALRWPERLGGVIAMSCYLPLPLTLGAEAHRTNASIPIFMAHGTSDPVVPCDLGEATRDLLRSKGYSIAWHAYQMQHSICTEETMDLREWLLRILALHD